MRSLLYFLCFLGAVFLGALSTWTVRYFAVSKGWAKGPSFEHHLHKRPIPRFGGVAIYWTFIVALCVLIFVEKIFHQNLGFSFRPVIRLLIPGTLMFAVGLLDDFVELTAQFKLIAQIVCGAILFISGFEVFYFPWNYAGHDLGVVLSLLATILWVVLISNAFNLIDGLDGLAVGSALFSTVSVFVVSVVHGNALVTWLSLVLAGSILGFLRYNFNPATIFLGDSGSLFVGFMLSALALAGKQTKAPTLVAIAIPLVSFGLPLVDTAISVLRRFLRGKSLFGADREHIHHKMMELGLSHRQVVIFLYGISALFALLSIFLLYPDAPLVGLVFAVVGVVFLLGVHHLGYEEFSEIRRVAQRTMEQRKIIVNNLAFRNAVKKLENIYRFRDIVAVLEGAFEENEFDGFELTIGMNLISNSAHRKPFVAIWSPANRPLHADDALWTLTLDLITPERNRIGYLKVYRKYSSQNLLIDVNLLILDLQPALSNAAELILATAEMDGASGDESRLPPRSKVQDIRK
jgi:UDP-GlcNAc:undecaprenyl-phosphate GlcNAc-1-phosphate transferase